MTNDVKVTLLILRNAGIVWLNRLHYFGARQFANCLCLFAADHQLCSLMWKCQNCVVVPAPPWDGCRVSRRKHHKLQVTQNQQDLMQCEDDLFKFVQIWTKQSRAEQIQLRGAESCICLWFYPVRNYKWLTEMMKQSLRSSSNIPADVVCKGTSGQPCILVQLINETLLF